MNVNSAPIDNSTESPKHKEFSKIRKVIIAEVILLIIFSFSFYKVVNENSKPENIALNFVRNINERVWNHLYDILLLSEDQFVSKDMLVKEISAGKSVKGRNYRVSDSESYYRDTTMMVWIDFMLETGEMETIEVNMGKEEEKKFGFINQWKVIPEFLVYDFELNVPLGAKGFVGGTELNDTYLYSEDDYNTVYSIPALFMENMRFRSGLILWRIIIIIFIQKMDTSHLTL